MISIKDAYNSEASQNTYLTKRWLTYNEEKIFESFSTDVKILDLWCWGGRTTQALYEKWFKNIVAIDIAEKLIEWAKNNHPNISHVFSVWNATDLQFNDQSFDVVFFSFNGLDYIPSREERMKVYQEIYRVLQPKWIFIFSSHNRYCLPVNRNLLKTQLQNIFRMFSEYWLTEQSFGKIYTYYSSPRQLQKDLGRFDFHKKQIYPHNAFLFPLFDTFPYYVYQKK